uniref:Polycystin cation channel PKD1/PKD2 domain-containing protein n=1 Tax=Palpitomonas bilix TaxID=652834 RepID=A0A7S3DBT8_9EUKA|mmetsp:Transcript_30836/g.80795  ORF Transcript_30836/g.80795 Transcript_30836/m.80795 type:complete len:684 (+) Transcript_30836:516-2567(+)
MKTMKTRGNLNRKNTSRGESGGGGSAGMGGLAAAFGKGAGGGGGAKPAGGGLAAMMGGGAAKAGGGGAGMLRQTSKIQGKSLMSTRWTNAAVKAAAVSAKKKSNIFKRILSYRKFYEVLFFIFFIIALTVVVLNATGNQLSFYYTQALRGPFVNNPLEDGGMDGFEDLAAAGDFFTFLRGPLSDAMFSTSYYNDDPIPDEYLGYISAHNMILGMTRLRQVRSAPNATCEIPTQVQSRIKVCYGDVSRTASGWAGELKEPESRWPNTGAEQYRWHNTSETQENSFSARLRSYPGSGFAVPIPRDEDERNALFDELESVRWLDERTRAVFVDFLVYNTNIDVLSIVKVMAEFPPTGGAIPSISMRNVRLGYLYPSRSTIFDLAWDGILLGVVVVYIIMLFVGCKRKGFKKQVLHFWGILDIANYFLFIIAYVLKFRAILICFNIDFPPPHNGFTNYETPGWSVDMWRNLMAINCTISWLKTFKFAGDVPFMAQIVHVIFKAGGDIASYLIIFVFVYMGFGLSHMLAYSYEVYEFRNLEATIYSLYRSVLGDFDFETMYFFNRGLGPFLFFAWTLLGLFILMNMFVAILMESYEDVKEEIPKKNIIEVLKSANFLKALATKSKFMALSSGLKKQMEQEKAKKAAEAGSGGGDDDKKDGKGEETKDKKADTPPEKEMPSLSKMVRNR